MDSACVTMKMASDAPLLAPMRRARIFDFTEKQSRVGLRIGFLSISVALVLMLQTSLAYAQKILATETTKGYAAGRTGGLASVGKDGEALYHVPLWVAPGRAGMQPNLALGYSSRAGNGLLGVGWSLSGFSRISRCPRTLVHEGQPHEIQFIDGDKGDRFCLNGQRLVLVGGARGAASAYGAHESEYRTEQDTHAKIVSYYPGPQGPRYFKVFLKNGPILTFGGEGHSTLEGHRASSRVIQRNTGYPVQYAVETNHDTLVTYAWALSRFEDRAGNFFTINYTIDVNNWGYEQRPVEIQYAGHVGTTTVSPSRTVRLLYEGRPDHIEQYVGGFRTILTQRLARIEVLQLNAKGVGRLRHYEFDYRSDTLSNRSLLTQFTECDGAGTCMRPTQIRWTAAVSTFGTSDLGPFDLTLTSRRESHAAVHVGDINGDGLDDLLLRPAAGGAWTYRLSTRSGFGGALAGPPSTPVSPGLPSGQRETEGRLVDLDADGRADFVVHELLPISGGPQIFKNQIYRATAAGFVTLPDAIETYEYTNREAYVLDLNGDGLPDLLKPVSDPNPPTGLKWAARLNGNGSFGSYVASGAAYSPPPVG